MKMEYTIHPVRMGGVIKELTALQAKVHLHGRLGVITVPPSLIVSAEAVRPGDEVEFWFSYLEVTETPYDYDSTAMFHGSGEIPCLLGGRLIDVNDTAAVAAIMDQLGTVAVPRRWIFTPVPLEKGLAVQFYFSPMRRAG